MDLNLKTERLGNDRIKISWNDATRRDFEEGAMGSFVILAAIFVLGSMFLLLHLSVGAKTISSGTFIIGLIASLFITVGILTIPLRSKATPNAVIISRSGIEHRGRKIAFADISRIEYDKKSQWSHVPEDTFDATEIRIWFADKKFYVISANAWEKRVNHEIKITIDEAVAALKTRPTSQSEQPQQAQPKQDHTPKSQNYGMPEY